jgi:hypothetical protein
MNINFAPRGILQIDDARIVYRNFSGAGSKFNREGDRNFSVVIPDRDLTPEEVKDFMELYREAELVDEGHGPVLKYDRQTIITLPDLLQAIGWNVKIKPPREDGDAPFIHLPIKIKFNDRGPKVYLKTGDNIVELEEEAIDCFDNIDILSVDMDVRPYDWEVNGKEGRTAYLQSICVTQDVDRFAARFTE